MDRVDLLCDMRLPFKQFATYAAIGILNNSFCYLLFLGFITIGLHYALAALFTSLIGLLINFKMVGRLVFNNNDKTLIFRFLRTYVIIYILNILLLRLLLNFNVDVRLGGILLLPPLALLAFVINKRFVFRTPIA